MKKSLLGLLLVGAMTLPLGMSTAHYDNNDCSDTYRPVCTTDHKTYANSCYARRDGKHVARNGKCTEAYFTPSQSNWHPYNWYNRSFTQRYYQPTYARTYTTYRRPTYSNYGYYAPTYARTYRYPTVRSASYYYPRW